ncbi:MAG: DciA family protein [Gemmatimonadales bacterium]
MKRLAPRHLRSALEAAVGTAEPAGLLARVQRLWPEAAGSAVAAESEPVSERDGVVTVHCQSAVWAQELEFLGPEIRARLNAAIAPGGEIRELRFTAAPRRPPRQRERGS